MLITPWAPICSFSLLSQIWTLGRYCNTDTSEERKKKKNPNANVDARNAEIKRDGEMRTNLEAMKDWAEILPASFIQREEDGVMGGEGGGGGGAAVLSPTSLLITSASRLHGSPFSTSTLIHFIQLDRFLKSLSLSFCIMAAPRCTHYWCFSWMKPLTSALAATPPPRHHHLLHLLLHHLYLMKCLLSEWFFT